MPPRSKLDKLPAATVERIRSYLAEQVRGVDEFTDWLAAELGVEVGRSSAHRFQQEFEEVAATMRESREIASALAEAVGPDMAAGKMGRMLVEIFQKLIFDFLVERTKSKEPLDPQSLMLLGRAIKDVIGALKSNTDRELAIRKETANKAADRAVKAADEQARAAGHKLPPEALKAIREQVYGVVDG